jgi:hypothetical protein
MSKEDDMKIEKLDRETIYDLADQDVTVTNIHRYYTQDKLTYEQALILMIKTLREEKMNYFDELMKYKRKYG